MIWLWLRIVCVVYRSSIEWMYVGLYCIGVYFCEDEVLVDDCRFGGWGIGEYCNSIGWGGELMMGVESCGGGDWSVVVSVFYLLFRWLFLVVGNVWRGDYDVKDSLL